MPEKQTKSVYQILRFNLTHKVRYLGITLTKHCSSLSSDNYTKTFNQTKDLKIWRKLQLSLKGTIALVKMNI